MVLSEQKQKEFLKRLLLSRMRILNNHGFYGLLLMHMRFALSDDLETAATDGERIYFCPEFLEGLSDRELDFVMMHEILHVVLRHCLRTGDRDQQRFNIACDIVVNSTILLENKMDTGAITLHQWGESMHLAPNGKEGYEYTAEQVYAMLPNIPEPGKGSKGSAWGRTKGNCGSRLHGSAWDDHKKWGTLEDNEDLEDVWVKRFADACEAIQVRDPSNSRGLMPAFAQRFWEELKKPQTDWRTVLNEFVQWEVNDYSFSPPDRRYQETPFFLPDFNEWGESDDVNDILFMIDTSASISDKMMTAAYSEIKGAIEQFNGKLKGWLGFFDCAVIEPVAFETMEEFRAIRPAGGGGTDFFVIFKYVRKHMQEKLPACIVILTDGYAPFPKEEAAMGIPVLWLINNDKIDPPWGKIARIKA